MINFFQRQVSIEKILSLKLILEFRFDVELANERTIHALKLQEKNCKLVLTPENLIIEQFNDKQYSIPRRAIRLTRHGTGRELEFDLGSRSPIQDVLAFRFQSDIEAQECYNQFAKDSIVFNEQTPEKSTSKKPEVTSEVSSVPIYSTVSVKRKNLIFSKIVTSLSY